MYMYTPITTTIIIMRMVFNLILLSLFQIDIMNMLYNIITNDIL